MEPELMLNDYSKIFVMLMMGKQISIQKTQKKFTNNLERDK